MNALETILIGIAFVLVALLWVALYPRPRLQLTERGFLDRNLRLGWIGWDEIEGAYTPRAQDHQGLRLRVLPREKLQRRLGRKGADASADGTYELTLDLSETDVSPVELLQEVLSRSGRSTTDEPAPEGACKILAPQEVPGATPPKSSQAPGTLFSPPFPRSFQLRSHGRGLRFP